MKTPLAELLEIVRPQDWKMDENRNVLNGKEQLRDKVCLLGFSLSMGSNPKAEANNTYVFHAATTLPALVAAAKYSKAWIDAAVNDCERNPDDDLHRSLRTLKQIQAKLEAALAAAENVTQEER